MKNNSPDYSGLEVAVIGMACRFPGADTWRDFWNNLVNAQESIQVLSDEKLAEMGIEESLFRQPNFVKVRNPFHGKDLFDSAFFDYRPDEARAMNPVHRVFHECVWEALEDAGYDPDQIKGSVGLFAGSNEDLDGRIYGQLKSEELDDLTRDYLNNRDYLAALVSYKLNLKGPAVSVNTACSTSLVAINMACKSLLLGESRMAIAGAASILTKDIVGYLHQEGMIGSSDGHCRTFDKGASGTVRGEGAGVVVLKRLTDALHDGDHIYAIIKGSSINNDGNRKVGFTAPSIEGQAECIRKAHQFSKVDPESISYIEAHGTGTRLGDPVEIEALNMAFKRNIAQRCAIGSVKTNIGHLDTAAGMAGFIKTVLSLKYRQLPASLHYKEPNPEIDFDNGPFYVNARLSEWPVGKKGPLRAGISSFGIGGTNAHLIAEEAPPLNRSDTGQPYKVLTLSAKTEGSLLNYAARLKQFLQNEAEICLNDMCYTFQAGRRHFSNRLAITFESREEIIRSLGDINLKTKITKGKNKNDVVFLFPGQGSQYAGMGRNLYAENTLFREIMDKGFSLIKELTGEDFETILYSEPDESHKINDTQYTQPALFLTEYALAHVLISLGIRPRYMLGHSVGEYVAACISGVFSFEDALKLLVRRGILINQLPGGEMVSVGITPDEAAHLVSESVGVAAINGPEQVVLSGDSVSIGELTARLSAQKIPFVKLRTSHAFHSPALDPISEVFKKEFDTVKFSKPQIPFVSNLTGKLISDEQACSPDYWVRHMRETVLFSNGVATLFDTNEPLTFIHAGPGQALTKLVQQQNTGKGIPDFVNVARSEKERINDSAYLTTGIGQLWALGVEIDWKAYYKSERRNRVSLPAYSFEQISYPIDHNTVETAVSFSIGKTDETDLTGSVYFPGWKSTVAVGFEEKRIQRVYLFFLNDNAFLKTMAERILGNEDMLIEVYAGTQYSRLSSNTFIVNPLSSADFIRMMADLQQDKIFITDVLYGWGMAVNTSVLKLSDTEPEIHLVYLSIIRTAQALAGVKWLSVASFIILSDSLHCVTGDEKISPAQSLMLSVVNVLPQEHPMRCSNIDVQLSEGNMDLTAVKVMAEIRYQAHGADRVVAYRRGKRWIQCYQKNAKRIIGKSTSLKQGGVYLITGGLGGVGCILAKYLLQKYNAKLILIGRTKIQEGNLAENGKEANKRYRDLKSLSDNVKYYSTDVSDLTSFTRTVHDAALAFGPIQGVIHTAGIIDAGYFELIEDISEVKALEMLAPKIAGIQNICQIFRDRNLDFVWATSSLASVLGGLGYTAYAAANLFMDSYIASISAEFPSWKSLCLGELAIDSQPSETKYAGLKPSEITDLFEWSLSQEVPVIIEAKGNLDARIHEVYSVRRSLSQQGTTEKTSRHKTVRPGVSTDFAAAENQTEQKLQNLFEDFFGLESVGVMDDFFELGGDSLKAMMLVKRIKQEFSVDLPLTDFLMRPTIRLMAARIDEITWFKSDVEMKNETTI